MDRLAITILAFAAGAVMHVVAVTFALLSNIGERLVFFLTPGGLLARELGLADPNWRLAFPTAAVLLAWYASWSNCAGITDAAARAECSANGGAQVFGMVLGVLLFV
jgi:hypothetical protein